MSTDLVPAAQAAVVPGRRDMEGRHLGFYANFPSQESEQVLLKAGISFVSVAGGSRKA